MKQKEIKLIAGQNIRYTGWAFPGFIKDQPYMQFVAYHNEHEAKVNYNGNIIIVSKYDIAPISI